MISSVRTASIALTLALATTAAIADTDSPKEQSAMNQSATRPIAVPSGYQASDRRQVTVDDEQGVLTRYVRSDGRNAGLGGEHFSTLVSDSGVLKGFANMSLDLVGKPLPSRERAEEVARRFLQQHAPELIERMKISWIEPHDEPLKVTHDGREEVVTLSGMKVKARNLADGRWFWIIVGSDGKPMVFERDIVWITFPGKRKTEKWLHDSWLATQPAPSAQSL
ncbi:hypothetical protein [Pseudomonas chlororaphis]|uniref:hypothetical protein n=1 Tax=Pseudomonas chlororaphis TaxID=587753 RepID=UPI0004CE7F46|nr:hypothetical protein [Pseudomonas chlororaphis]AZD30360.1 hypothetical protein C4K23_3613 [Pseudomonas chlororaphis]QFS55747.1 hypothetical protein FD951_14790 [Pseudomonas chlororaphis subsp. aurantiaca]